ncbi:MAG: DUF3795 domain-containing protein [Lachnospiraceae bacterium]|nr:DUF3795 domain-containing protein [Lachnospiraceae bacterium]
MGETYCGKNCEQCNYKERLECTGCKAGPGRELYGECKIASCCRDRGHQDCNTCIESNACAMLSGRGTVPEFLLKTKDEGDDVRGFWAEKAPMLSKWMMTLFVLNIVQILAKLLSIDTIREMVPVVYIIGILLGVMISAVMCVVLFKMQDGSEHFRVAGGFMLADVLLELALILIPSVHAALALLRIILVLAAFIVELLLYYHEFKGFEEALEYVYPMLAESWNFLWKLFVGYCIGFVAGFILMLVVRILGLLIFLVSLIVAVVASILRLVYMYRSATKFKYYSA